MFEKEPQPRLDIDHVVMSQLGSKSGKTALYRGMWTLTVFPSGLYKHVPGSSLRRDDSKFCPWHRYMQEIRRSNQLGSPAIRLVWERAQVRFDANRFSSSRVIAVMTGSTRTGSSNGGGHGIGYCSSITAVFVAFVGPVCDSASRWPGR